MPFREHVVKYPPRSPLDTPIGYPPKINVPDKNLNGSAASPARPRGVPATEALKRKTAVNSGIPAGPPGIRPEDKPDTPEYKKKQAMLAGPILELTYENASIYGMEESTFTALKDIFMAVIENPSRHGVLSPQRFLEIFRRDNEMFRTSMHQDAHEFYGLVLNAVITNVEDNAKRMRELKPPREDGGLSPSVVSAVTNAASSMGLPSGARSPGTGWVHEIFEGVLTSETKCLTCETTSQRDETFLDLSIDLEEHSSVTSCLLKFSAEEMLCERNKFHCDNCGGLQEAEKRMKIKRLPKILALHLKRFKYTEDMTRLQKLFHRVVYPYHLRMFNTTDDIEDPDRLYELYAVVVHIGGNAYHGHYVSVIKTRDRGWLLFDDEMVEPVDKHYVRNFFGDRPGMACAYVLFYQETTLEAVQKEQEAEGQAEGQAEIFRASQEAVITLGHPQPNGLHSGSISKQVSAPSTPVDETEGFCSLDTAISAPGPAAPVVLSPIVPKSQGFMMGWSRTAQNNPAIPTTDGKKADSKLDKERERKEKKEAERAQKAAEKEKIKAEEKRRKELDVQRRELQKTQAEEARAALATSKLPSAEDEEKRRRDTTVAGSPPEKKENGFKNGLSLSRGNKGSKSMSRKSFGWLRSGEGGKDAGDTRTDGEVNPQATEKHEKPPKDRFSFGLGRKKSGQLSS